MQNFERQEEFKAITAIEQRLERAYIVRLREDLCVGHAVVVDVSVGVIFDSEEVCSFVISAENLQRCGPKNYNKFRVCEVRNLK